ncbi:DUF3987 domain-containing protein [Dapis sp. BLCC M229]|uniref:DUF3987 domain-containing protein n=1 Tax=Dapis sp. BLCC M229 TaxID=3400188 RepID=UPI003CF54F05
MNTKNLKAKVNQFLCFLGYTSNDNIYFRAFKKENGKNFGKKTSYSLELINYKELLQWESLGYGVYIVVNGGGDADADVTTGKAIFYEHDDLPQEQQLVLWQNLGLPEPTIQVDTGGKSIHSYWVFEQPIAIKQWQELQADLLEYADGDRSIKNPSRVMRVPGFKHQKSGKVAEIVSSSGTKYSYQELRSTIPRQKEPIFNFDKTIQTNTPPLAIFLTKDDRDLIERGVSEGGRNNAGAKLARNLIGTAQRLNYLGINYTDTPQALFEDYCSRCSPPINSKEAQHNSKEAQQIWKSAQKGNPIASLTDDAIENCLKAWQKNQHYSRNSSNSDSGKGTSQRHQDNSQTKGVILPKKWDKLKVLGEIIKLAEQRPRKSRVTIELKQLSLDSGWDIRSLKEIYESTIEDFDADAELPDDEKEFSEILSANVKLKCHAMLPQELHPVLTFADNLGVPYEPTLVALEAAAASLIDPDTKIIGRECSNYDQNATIFSAIVGEPASRKSPLIQAIARKPLSKMQEKATELYDRQKIDYERDLADWEAADKATRGDKPEEPKLRVFSTGDYTPEGMRELAQHNPKILRCFDELAKEQKSQGQYKGGKGSDAQLLLESYDGLMDTVIRRGKIYPGGVVNQCLLGGIQPEVLSEIISSSDPTGLFARYNIATLPNIPHYWDDDNEVGMDITPLLVDTYESINRLPAITFKLSPDAYQLFKSCHNHAESQKAKADRPAMIYQYGKMSGKILRWAMLYHVLHAVCQGKTPDEIVSKKFIQIAKERAIYQMSQVRGLLSIMDDSGPSKMFQLYQYALRKGEPITPRDAVYKTKKAKDRGEAIDFFRRLEEMGWGRTITTPRTIKFEAFEERRISDPSTTVQVVTKISKSGDSLPKPVTVVTSEVETQVNAATINKTQTPVIDRDTDQVVTTVTDTSQRLSKIVDDLRNCDREKFMMLCDKSGKEELQQACQILDSSNDEEDKKQFQKIKFWAYERQLGGELKVGHLIQLKGGDDSSFNTWEIKSVESNRLWVERTGYRVKPETRRVKFSDVEKIYTKS